MHITITKERADIKPDSELTFVSICLKIVGKLDKACSDGVLSANLQHRPTAARGVKQKPAGYHVPDLTLRAACLQYNVTRTAAAP